MRVLIACEESGIMRDAFLLYGHDVWSCDILPTSTPGPHYKCDIREVLYEQWDMLIAHPVCKYLSNSGSKHLYRGMKKEGGICPDRWQNMKEAVKFFKLFQDVKIKKKIIENPIIHSHAKKLIGQQSQVFQPWHHGHKEIKATCLWLYGVDKLEPSNIVGPPPKDKLERNKWARVHMMGPGPNRPKMRSRTLPRVAAAFANQYGKTL